MLVAFAILDGGPPFCKRPVLVVFYLVAMVKNSFASTIFLSTLVCYFLDRSSKKIMDLNAYTIQMICV